LLALIKSCWVAKSLGKLFYKILDTRGTWKSLQYVRTCDVAKKQDKTTRDLGHKKMWRFLVFHGKISLVYHNMEREENERKKICQKKRKNVSSIGIAIFWLKCKNFFLNTIKINFSLEKKQSFYLNCLITGGNFSGPTFYTKFIVTIWLKFG